MNEHSGLQPAGASKSQKKSYHKPIFASYGPVEKLTQGQTGTSADGQSGRSKTGKP